MVGEINNLYTKSSIDLDFKLGKMREETDSIVSKYNFKGSLTRMMSQNDAEYIGNLLGNLEAMLQNTPINEEEKVFKMKWLKLYIASCTLDFSNSEFDEIKKQLLKEIDKVEPSIPK